MIAVGEASGQVFDRVASSRGADVEPEWFDRLGLALRSEQPEARPDDPSHQQHHHRDARRRPCTMPTHELTQTIGGTRRARLHRLAAKVPADVRG